MTEVSIDSTPNPEYPILTESNTQNENDSIISKLPASVDDVNSISNIEFEISAEKLALVLGITISFILLLLLSLICVFYLMGLLQNVFGYSWARPMGRTFSTVHSSHSSSSQQIAIDSNSNLVDVRPINQAPGNVTTVAIEGPVGYPEQCYMCTAIACNGNALGYAPNGNIRSC